MTTQSTMNTRRLLLHFVLQEIDYAKECRRLQEMIKISKEQDQSFQHTLVAFLEDSVSFDVSQVGFNQN
jgi:hypothetical protein